MVELIRDEGYDIVSHLAVHARRAQIGGPLLKKLMSRVAGLSLHWLTGLPTHDATNAFRVYRRGSAQRNGDRKSRRLRVFPGNHREGVRGWAEDHGNSLNLARPLRGSVAVQATHLAAPLPPLVLLRADPPPAAPTKRLTPRTCRSLIDSGDRRVETYPRIDRFRAIASIPGLRSLAIPTRRASEGRWPRPARDTAGPLACTVGLVWPQAGPGSLFPAGRLIVDRDPTRSSFDVYPAWRRFQVTYSIEAPSRRDREGPRVPPMALC